MVSKKHFSVIHEVIQKKSNINVQIKKRLAMEEKRKPMHLKKLIGSS